MAVFSLIVKLWVSVVYPINLQHMCGGGRTMEIRCDLRRCLCYLVYSKDVNSTGPRMGCIEPALPVLMNVACYTARGAQPNTTSHGNTELRNCKHKQPILTRAADPATTGHDADVPDLATAEVDHTNTRRKRVAENEER